MQINNPLSLTILSALICFAFNSYAANPISLDIVSSEVGQMVIEVNRALPDPNSNQVEQWYVLENGQKKNITKWQRNSRDEGINAVLIFDHSSGWAGTPFNWKSVKRSISKLIDGFNAEQDSLALIGFAESVDMNTDLTDNFEVLKMILNGSEEAPGQALPQAMKAGIEALNPYAGNKAIFIISSGYSERSPGDIFREIELPVYVLAPGYKEDWAYFSWTSGGLYEDLALLMNGDIESSEWRSLPIASTQISFVSTLPMDATRAIELFAPNLYNDGPLAETSSDKAVSLVPMEDVDGGASDKADSDWIYLAIPIIIGLAVLIYLARYFMFRTSKGTVAPGITQLQYNAKKHELLAQVNIPIRTKPAKFTLHNHSGTPVRDQIISGTSRRVKMDLDGLPQGVYKCSLSNAGMTSEHQEIVLG
ncbi:MAG: vWA domain-containing protein [Bacteroidota bacterium]